MCSSGVPTVMARVLETLEGSARPRTGRELSELLNASEPVCEAHFYLALQRLVREEKAKTAGGHDGAAAGDRDLLERAFVPFPRPLILNGRWKLLEPIGHGGTSTVYKAEQIELGGRLVAVKMSSVAHFDPAVQAEVKARGEREAMVLARLTHPNIVVIHGAGSEGDRFYIVMEHLAGGTLGDRMKARGGRLPWREALEIAIALSGALARAAAQGVLHRDIKPENVMFDGQGNVRITDFGLAKPLPSHSSGGSQEPLTRIEALRGTPNYMAPELWELIGPPGGDERSDVYAFGMMLRYLLTGELPFEFPAGQRLLQWHKHHVDTLPRALAELLPECPREISEAIDRMIRKRPEDRYPSFEKLWADLRRIASRLPRSATTISRPPTTVLRPATGIVPLRHDTALSEFIDLLEVEVSRVVSAYLESFGSPGMDPRVVRAVWTLARREKAVPFAAAIWAAAEPGRTPGTFEPAFEAALSSLERGEEAAAGASSVPLDLGSLLWIALSKAEREKRETGRWGDVSALEGLLAFLAKAVGDPSLDPLRLAKAPAPPPPPELAVPLAELSRPTEARLGTVVVSPQAEPLEKRESSPDLLIGRTIDQYEIRERIGEGGMGTVYLAQDLTLDRPVALKVLHARFASEKAFAQRFIREAQLAARLAHPNLVPVYRAGKEGDLLWYVMEFVPSRKTLGALGRLGLEETLRVGLEIAQGLHAIHSLGYVHRDIKPDNLMIVPGQDGRIGQIKILDAGLLRPVDDPKSITTDRQFLGTVEYASPEQAREEPLDPRTDLYSTGVILYELLAGTPNARPYTASSKTTYLLQTVDPRTPPVPLRDRNPGVPADVAALVHRLIEKDPRDRVQSAAELVRLIEELLARLSGPKGADKGSPRRRLLAAALIPALALAAWALAPFLTRKPPARGTTRPTFELTRTPESTPPGKPPDPPLEVRPAEIPKDAPKEPPKPAPPLPDKVPDVRVPKAGEIPVSPAKEETPQYILSNHAPSKEELALLEELLHLSRASLPARSAYLIQEALAKTVAFRESRSRTMTPWLSILASAERERLECGHRAFRARPLFAPAAEQTLVLRDSVTLQGKILSQQDGGLTFETLGGARKEIAIREVAPVSFPQANADSLEALLARSAAGDARGALEKAGALDETDRLRFLPFLLDQSIEEVLLAVSLRADVRPLLGFQIAEAHRATAERLFPARVRLLETEQEAAKLYERRGSDPKALARLFSELPSTRAGARASQEVLAAFTQSIPPDSESEVGRWDGWGYWKEDTRNAKGGGVTASRESDVYLLSAQYPGAWVWIWKNHEGAKKGYRLQWTFKASTPDSGRFWVALSQRRRLEIGRKDTLLYRLENEGGEEKPVLGRKVDHPSPVESGVLTLVPRGSQVLVFMNDRLLLALDEKTDPLEGRIQLGASGGALTIESIRVVDRNAK